LIWNLGGKVIDEYTEIEDDELFICYYDERTGWNISDQSMEYGS
jgi:hypothetical protein